MIESLVESHDGCGRRCWRMIWITGEYFRQRIRNAFMKSASAAELLLSAVVGIQRIFHFIQRERGAGVFGFHFSRSPPFAFRVKSVSGIRTDVLVFHFHFSFTSNGACRVWLCIAHARLSLGQAWMTAKEHMFIVVAIYFAHSTGTCKWAILSNIFNCAKIAAATLGQLTSNARSCLRDKC